MRTISSNCLKPMSVANKSIVFMTIDNREMFYASRRVANEIFQANLYNEFINVYIEEAKDSESDKPYNRLGWLMTPSRF